MSREDVYKLIDGERAYQDRRWGGIQAEHNQNHSPTEFLVYIRDYVEEALHRESRECEDAELRLKTMASVRKIAALAVVCMEVHGAPSR